MMSYRARRELLAEVAPRYQSARRDEKKRILDEFVQITGYHRKYALNVLNHPEREERPKRRRRKRKYGANIIEPLVRLWRVANCICGKRLVPFLAELISVLERHSEIKLEATVRELLLEISAATVDRLLRPKRQGMKPRGMGTTKPGTLLKHQIPVRTFADWTENKPGFLEIDLVAHCAFSTEGEYLHTLVLTDIYTTWTMCVALRHRSQQQVSAAIDQVRQDLPFALLGLDSDNGAEFINANLLRYCQQHQITFTRSRPYKKNDQAHVEQKNWTHVRQCVGYARYEGDAAYKALQALYEPLNLYMNFFQPTLKLIRKEQVAGHVRKTYDTAQTPYQRICGSEVVSEERKRALRLLYETLNPAALLRQITRLQDQLWTLETVISTSEATLPSE